MHKLQRGIRTYEKTTMACDIDTYPGVSGITKFGDITCQCCYKLP